MEKTPRYQLSQWEKTDRILMEDFNADNANLEAALTALNTGKADLAAFNSAKSAFQKEDARLNSVKLQLVDLGSVTLNVPGGTRMEQTAINGALLGQCAIAFLDVTASRALGESVGVLANGSGSMVFRNTSDYYRGLTLLRSNATSRLIFFPLGDPDSRVTCLCLSVAPSVAYSDCTFRGFTNVGLYANGSGSPTLLEGTVQFHMWGLKGM